MESSSSSSEESMNESEVKAADLVVGNGDSLDADTQPSEKVSFTLVFKKQNFSVEFGMDSSVGDLRQEVARLSGVPAALQKLMLKGILKNDAESLRTAGFKNGVKVMLVGSTIQEVMSTATTEATASSSTSSSEAEKEHMSEKLPHKKVIDKGKPEKAMPGLKGRHEQLPQYPLEGICNNRGDTVRLTFKVFSQELWISSKASTQKIPFITIKSVQSEPIKGQEEYHIMSLQLGSSDATKYYLYWVPAQFSRAIANTIMADYTGGY